MRTVVVINVHSRNGRELHEQVIKNLEKNDKFNIVKIILIKKIKKLDQYLSELKNTKNIECVVIGSGDGTIVAVFNALKNRKNLKYILLPLGTSNTFVKSLGLPGSYKTIRKQLNSYKPFSIPLGNIDGVLFGNIAGIGIPAKVSQETDNKLKKIFGPLAYVIKGFQILKNHDPIFCNVTYGKKGLSFYTHYLLIANGPYHGPLPLKKDLSVADRHLVLVAFGVTSDKSSHLKSIFKFLMNRHQNDDNIKIIPLKEAKLNTIPMQQIEADGEIIGNTPARISIKSRAVKVFLPKKPPSHSSKKRKARS